MFERFADQRVHMLTQSASDLNDSRGGRGTGRAIGSRVARQTIWKKMLWIQRLAPVERDIRTSGSHSCRTMVGKEEDILLDKETISTPQFVYDLATISARSNEMLSLGVDRVFFAIKSNPHPGILRLLEQQGVGFECVSRRGEARPFVVSRFGGFENLVYTNYSKA